MLVLELTVGVLLTAVVLQEAVGTGVAESEAKGLSKTSGTVPHLSAFSPPGVVTTQFPSPS